MPTYDYECTACGHRFEAFQSMSEDPLNDCPECGKKVRRLIGAGLGIIFKGSGFYVTDSRDSRGKAEGDAKSGDAKDGETKGGEASKKDGSSTDSSKGDSGSTKTKETAKT